MARSVSGSTSEQVSHPYSVRDEQRELTRLRLVGAARAVFERAGYGKATIGDITAEASINRATFYLHFTNKADVFAAVLDHMLIDTARYWVQLDEALMAHSQAAVRDWLENAVGWWEENAALQPAWHEAMAMDLAVASRWKSILDELAVQLRRYLGRLPEQEREDARTRVELLVVQLDQVCLRWRVQQVFDADRGRLLDLLADMWCAVLRIP